jgi:hypothetical protein
VTRDRRGGEAIPCARVTNSNRDATSFPDRGGVGKIAQNGPKLLEKQDLRLVEKSRNRDHGQAADSLK